MKPRDGQSIMPELADLELLLAAHERQLRRLQSNELPDRDWSPHSDRIFLSSLDRSREFARAATPRPRLKWMSKIKPKGRPQRMRGTRVPPGGRARGGGRTSVGLLTMAANTWREVGFALTTERRAASAAICLVLAIAAGIYGLVSFGLLDRSTKAPDAAVPSAQHAPQTKRSPVTTVEVELPTERELAVGRGDVLRPNERPTKLKINRRGYRNVEPGVIVAPAPTPAPRPSSNGTIQRSSSVSPVRTVPGVKRFAPMTLGELIQGGER